MMDRRSPRLLAVGLVCSFALAMRATAAAPEPPVPPIIDFDRDIRPILADNCYQCHGPDKNKRRASLRLDTKEGIFSGQGGVAVVDPGKPHGSELFRRIT